MPQSRRYRFDIDIVDVDIVDVDIVDIVGDAEKGVDGR